MSTTYTNAWCFIEFQPRAGAGDLFQVDCAEFPFITGVKVTKNLGMVTEISIDIDMPFDIGKKFLNNELAPGVLFANTLLRVRMGYGNPTDSTNALQSEDYLGILNKGGLGLELSPNGLTGSITAVSVTPQAARLAASDNGLTLEQELRKRVELAGFDSLEVLPSAQNIFSALMQQPKSSLPFASNGAVRHLEYIDLLLFTANLTWTESNNESGRKLIVQSVASMGKIVQFRFIMRGGFDYDVNNNQTSYPIVSFSPEQKEVLFYAGIDPATLQAGSVEINSSGKLVVQTVSAIEAGLPKSTKKEDPITPNPQSDRRGRGGRVRRSGGRQRGGSIPATVDRPMAPKELGGLKEVTKPEAPNLTEIMFEELKQQNQRFIPGLTATLTTFGIPHIKPGCFVVVENVGSLYDGTYALHGVTHSWSGQAIESTLTLRSYTPQVSNVVEGVVKPSANLSGSQQ